MKSFTTLIGLFGTILGAFLGAWATKRLSRPKPVILIDRIQISSGEGSPDEIITPNKRLINSCNTAPIYLPETFPFERMNEREYLDRLQKILQRIEEACEHTLPSLKELALSFRENLAAEDYKSLEKVWAQEQSNIWSFILTGRSKEAFDYKSELDSTPCLKVEHIVEDDDIASFYVRIPTLNSNLRFWYPTKNLIADELKAFCEKTAYAFAGCNNRNLLLHELLNFINKVLADNEAVLNELHQNIKEELNRYNRLIIKGQISNIGGSPFSVLSKGKVFILAKDYPYSDADEYGHTIFANLNRDISIELQIINSKSENNVAHSYQNSFNSSISVQPGGICDFVAISDQYIEHLGVNGKVLPKLFESAERYFYLALSVVLPGGQPLKTYYTNSQIFRDLSRTAKIKPKRGFLIR